jgi:hypothetical protein
MRGRWMYQHQQRPLTFGDRSYLPRELTKFYQKICTKICTKKYPNQPTNTICTQMYPNVTR